MDGFLKYNWPRAILHVDGDSFFVSCEVAMNPSLRGKPVVTGSERGIASAMSPEAKRAGITRGMPIHMARKLVPGLIVVPGDFEAYELFSHRMLNIVRRYTPEVENYSVDECFADLTGLRRSLNMTYAEMAQAIKKDLQTELGLTFSVGLSVTKTLAKIATNFKKPDGFTVIPGKSIKSYLIKTKIEDVWGIGIKTFSFLKKLGISNALQLAEKDEAWVRAHLSKPFLEKWRELRGEATNFVDSEAKTSQKSISKTRSFVPATSDKNFLLARLSQNIEGACVRARSFNLVAKRVLVFLKTNDFKFHTLELKLAIPTSNPSDIIGFVEEKFLQMYKPVKYRTTGVTLCDLTNTEVTQVDLFGQANKIEAASSVFSTIDEIALKYGRGVVRLASSFQKFEIGREKNPSKEPVVFGTKSKKLAIPHFGLVK